MPHRIVFATDAGRRWVCSHAGKVRTEGNAENTRLQETGDACPLSPRPRGMQSKLLLSLSSAQRDCMRTSYYKWREMRRERSLSGNCTPWCGHSLLRATPRTSLPVALPRTRSDLPVRSPVRAHRCPAHPTQGELPFVDLLRPDRIPSFSSEARNAPRLQQVRATRYRSSDPSGLPLDLGQMRE